MGERSETVRLQRAGRTATLLLDRPPLNVLDLSTIAQLGAHLERLAADDSLQVLVLRGAGGRAFSAGVAVEDHTPDKVAPMLTGFHAALRSLFALDTTTIAVVDGHCLGGGMELAAVCDLVVASERSRFGQPEIHLGCYPPLAAALYPTLLGPGPAADLVLTGRTLDCAEAERLGFVARRVADGQLEAAASELVATLTAHSGVALRLAKRALRAARAPGFAAALAESERLYLEALAPTHDLAEGVQAFLDKRPPVWRHC